MAKAFKCDRCGRYYEEHELESAFEHLERTLTVVEENEYKYAENMDLCPNCTFDLDNFLRND